MKRSVDKKPYVPAEAVVWGLYDTDKPFHTFVFNVSHDMRTSCSHVSFQELTVKYRTRPVLEFMNIIEPIATSPARGQRARPQKRKSDEVADEEAENEAKDDMDIKPGQDALLLARLRDLKVSYRV